MRVSAALLALLATCVIRVHSDESTDEATPAPSPEGTFAPTDCSREEAETPWYEFCNCDYMSYSYWYNTNYDPNEYIEGDAAAIEGFFGIDTSNVFEALGEYEGTTKTWDRPHGMMTNGVVMEKAAEMCELGLKTLKLDLAGRHGAVDQQNIYIIMCHEYCMISDEMHEKAMEVSRCNCMELSTFQEGESPVKVIGNELQWHTAGDFCKRNSARMLCTIFESCGVWECALEDFSCPRHEWEHGESIVRGITKSNQCGRAGRGAAPSLLWSGMLVTSLAAVFAAAAADWR